MPLYRRILFLLPVLLFFGHAIGQWWPPKPPFPFRHPGPPPALFRIPPDPPVRKWVLSFNPLGLLESAYGIGIGYHLNKNSEIWSETSLLRGQPYAGANPLTGFRQIVQYKRFIPSVNENFFLGFEMRYKYYSYRDTNDFANPGIPDTLRNVQFLSEHHIFGAALQVGRRFALSKEGRFQIETMIGFGVKDKFIDRRGPPAGYHYLDGGKSIDLSIRDLVEQSGTTIYLPGSVRLIYCFGKKFR